MVPGAVAPLVARHESTGDSIVCDYIRRQVRFLPRCQTDERLLRCWAWSHALTAVSKLVTFSARLTFYVLASGPSACCDCWESVQALMAAPTVIAAE